MCDMLLAQGLRAVYAAGEEACPFCLYFWRHPDAAAGDDSLVVLFHRVEHKGARKGQTSVGGDELVFQHVEGHITAVLALAASMVFHHSTPTARAHLESAAGK